MRNYLEIAFDTGLVSQSNVLNWSATNSHLHINRNVICSDWKAPEQTVNFTLYRHSFSTGSQHYLSCHANNMCMGHEISLLIALKIQQNRSSSQLCAKQETGKCCVVPRAQKLGRLAGQWIGLKQEKGEERLRWIHSWLTGCDTNALSLTAVSTVLCLKK